MKKTIVPDDAYLEATTYIRRNRAIILRSALSARDPESWQSLWKKKYGSLDGFPWVELFGREPTVEELVEMGVMACPTCGREWNER